VRGELGLSAFGAGDTTRADAALAFGGGRGLRPWWLHSRKCGRHCAGQDGSSHDQPEHFLLRVIPIGFVHPSGGIEHGGQGTLHPANRLALPQALYWVRA
jgi:hypothetical protein